MQRDWMQCIPCSVKKWNPIECKDFMQHYWMQWIQKARLNAVDFMQHGPKHPDRMQWIPCSVVECREFHALWRNGSRLYAVESMQWDEGMDSMQPVKMHPDCMQWIPCSVIECIGFYSCYLMQCNSCSLVKWIPIECSGFHAAWLSAVDSIQLSTMNPD